VSTYVDDILGELPPPVRRVPLDRHPTVVPRPADDDRPGTRRSRGAGGPERMRVESLTVRYGDKPAVRDVSLRIHQGEVLALIGPSGCGKTTLLRTLNRLTETTEGASRDGSVLLDGGEVEQLEVTALRRRVGMVFQQPNPFPMSIFDNLAYALRVQNRKRPGRRQLEPLVVDALRRAGLYD
jgi:phosphate transport system ATP-binding protein